MHFNSHVAIKYGVEEAIIINHLVFWIHKNKCDRLNHYDGRTWTYFPVKDLVSLFTFWSIDQIKRIIKRLEQKGAVISGNYNKVKFDRTKWYALENEAEMFTLHNLHDPLCGIAQSESAESHNGMCGNHQPIPNNKTYNEKDNNNPLTPLNEKKKEKLEKWLKNKNGNKLKKTSIETLIKLLDNGKAGNTKNVGWDNLEEAIDFSLSNGYQGLILPQGTHLKTLTDTKTRDKEILQSWGIDSTADILD